MASVMERGRETVMASLDSSSRTLSPLKPFPPFRPTAPCESHGKIIQLKIIQR